MTQRFLSILLCLCMLVPSVTVNAASLTESDTSLLSELSTKAALESENESTEDISTVDDTEKEAYTEEMPFEETWEDEVTEESETNVLELVETSIMPANAGETDEPITGKIQEYSYGSTSYKTDEGGTNFAVRLNSNPYYYYNNEAEFEAKLTVNNNTYTGVRDKDRFYFFDITELENYNNYNFDVRITVKDDSKTDIYQDSFDKYISSYNSVNTAYTLYQDNNSANKQMLLNTYWNNYNCYPESDDFTAVLTLNGNEYPMEMSNGSLKADIAGVEIGNHNGTIVIKNATRNHTYTTNVAVEVADLNKAITAYNDTLYIDDAGSADVIVSLDYDIYSDYNEDEWKGEIAYNGTTSELSQNYSNKGNYYFGAKLKGFSEGKCQFEVKLTNITKGLTLKNTINVTAKRPEIKVADELYLDTNGKVQLQAYISNIYDIKAYSDSFSVTAFYKDKEIALNVDSSSSNNYMSDLLSDIPAGKTDIKIVCKNITKDTTYTMEKEVEVKDGAAAVRVPSYYYSINGKTKLFIQYALDDNNYSNSKATAKITIDGNEISLSDKGSYGILGSSEIELNPGEYKDAVISIQDSASGLSFVRTTDVVVKSMEMGPIERKEIAREDSNLSISFLMPEAAIEQIKTGYIKSGSDRIAVLDKSSLNYSYNVYVYTLKDRMQKDGALSEFGGGNYSLPFGDLSSIKEKSLGFNFVKKITGNSLDVELVMNDNKIITFADVASIIDVPYITGQNFYGNSNNHEIPTKDYIFAEIYGINLDKSKFYPVLSIDGKDITSSNESDVSTYAGRYRLKKTADYPDTENSFEATVRFITKQEYTLTYSPDFSKTIWIGGGDPAVFFNSAAEEWHLYYGPKASKGVANVSIQYNGKTVATATVTPDDSGDVIFEPIDSSNGDKYRIPAANLGNLYSYEYIINQAGREYEGNIWYTHYGYDSNSGGQVSNNDTFYNQTTNIQPTGTSVEYKFGGYNTAYKDGDEFEISLYETTGDSAVFCGKETAKCTVSNKELKINGTMKLEKELSPGRYMVTVKDPDGRYRIGNAAPSNYNLRLLDKDKYYQNYASLDIDGDNIVISTSLYHIGKVEASKVKATFYDPITLEEIPAKSVKTASIRTNDNLFYTWENSYYGVLDKYRAFWVKITYDNQLLDDAYYFTGSYYDRNPGRMSREYGELISSIGGGFSYSTRIINGLRFYRTVGVRVNGVKKYTVSIYSHRTKDFITSFPVTTSDYYYFTRSDLSALLKNDTNLEKPYTVVAEKDGVIYGVLAGCNLWYDNQTVQTIPATGITFESKEQMLQIGETLNLNPTITPANANTGRDITYKSSDEKVATVNSNGTVTALSVGETTITATLEKGAKAECKIYVEAKLDNLAWKAGMNNPVIKLGESIRIGFETVPAGATIPGKEVWTVQDSSIADIVAYEGMSAAVITGKKAGTTLLKVTAGGIELQTNITVTADVKLDVQNGTLEAGAPSTVHINDSNMISDLPVPTRADYAFAGWYSKPNGKGTGVTEETYITPYTFATKEDGTKDYTLYAYWLPKTVVETVGAGLRIEGLGDQVYTGKAIKPELKIYDGNVKLIEGVDYSLSYKNNINAWIDGYDGRKEPTITVKGLGNYTKTFTVNFQILPKNLSDKDISIDDISVAYNKKNQKVSPKIYYQGKALKNSDFTVATEERKDPGVYPVVITGKGNFTGTYTMNFTIKADSKKLISKASITLSSSMKKRVYDPKNPTKPQVAEQSGDIVVKISGNTLVENKDYVLQYQNNIYPGKATIIVVGKGLYAGGTKRSGFDIQGLKLAGDVYYEGNKLTSMTYTGGNIVFDKTLLTLKDTKGNIITGDDFDIALENNKKPGKAKLSIIGKNAYNGSVLNKNFTIDKYKLQYNDVVIGLSAPYAKGGATQVDREVYFNGELLSEGVDYTVKFANNKSITENAQIIITGKGMFAGTVSKDFKVEKQDLSLLMMTAPAVAAGVDITKLKLGVMDLDGKALKAKIDYDSNITFYADEYAAGDPLTAEAISGLEEGTEIFAKVVALPDSNYEGELISAIRIGQKDISKVTAKVKAGKAYYYKAGNELVFDEEILEIFEKGSTTPLKLNQDFEIIGTSYLQNRNKGNASFIIRGINDFGGSKVIKFSIKAQEIAEVAKQ